MNEIVITHRNDPEIAEVKATLERIGEEASGIIINSDESRNGGIFFLARIKEALNKLEDRRKFYKAPLDEQSKELQRFFKNLSEPLENADRIVRKAVEGYAWKLEQERRKQEQKNAERMRNAIENDKPIPILKTVDAPETIRTVAGTMTMKAEWRSEVFEEEMVPRTYCSVDQAKIRLAVKNGVRDIPGVRIYEAMNSQLR